MRFNTNPSQYTSQRQHELKYQPTLAVASDITFNSIIMFSGMALQGKYLPDSFLCWPGNRGDVVAFGKFVRD